MVPSLDLNEIDRKSQHNWSKITGPLYDPGKMTMLYGPLFIPQEDYQLLYLRSLRKLLLYQKWFWFLVFPSYQCKNHLVRKQVYKETQKSRLKVLFPNFCLAINKLLIIDIKGAKQFACLWVGRQFQLKLDHLNPS